MKTINKILLGLIFFVNACGFRPLYYKTDLAHNDIFIKPIAEFMGQKLRFELRERLSPAGLSKDAKYFLDVKLIKNTYEKQALREDSTSTRYTMQIDANFKLVKDGKVIFKDSIKSRSSYDILSAPYATVASEKTAEDNIITRLADQISLRIDVFMKNHGE